MASEMKNLLEGEGMSINTKMGNKKLMFVGCHFMITSNNLPTKKILKATIYDDKQIDEWEPFEERCEFVCLSVRYDKRCEARFDKYDVCRYWMSK